MSAHYLLPVSESLDMADPGASAPKSTLASHTTARGWFGRLSLAGRLFLLTSLVTTVVMAVITLVMGLQVRTDADLTVQREVETALTVARESFELAARDAKAQGQALLPVLERELGGIPALTGDTLLNDDGREVPLLAVDGSVINSDISALERLQTNTGADAAVIVRAQDQWVRAATLLRNSEGQLMLDSVVAPQDLLSRTLDGGEPYSGLVQRNGKWYAMSIQPLKDESGVVYGGFSVRVSIDSQVEGLLDFMRSMKVARFGLLGVAHVDAQGAWQPAVADGSLSAGLSSTRQSALGQLAGARAQGFDILRADAAGADILAGWTSLPDWNWVLYGAGERRAFLADSNRVILVQSLMMLVGAGIIAILVWWVVRRTVKPLGLVVAALDRVGKGDLTVRLPVVDPGSRNEIHLLFGHVTRTQRELRQTIGSVRDGVSEIRVAVSEISAGNTDLASRTEEQAASLQETAASMEQLSATVRQNTEHARRADTMAGEFSQIAHRGEGAVCLVVQTMEDIASSSKQIGNIVDVIDGIAFQTNILALNAAVEAARAGEEGRGFAVVAGEVRALAQRSAQAAGEIKVLIDASVSKVDAGVQEVSIAGKTMSDLLAAVADMTRIMKEIAHASTEQAGGIGEVNRAVSQMDEVTQQNAALVEQAVAALGSLSAQADRLARAVDVFVIQSSDATAHAVKNASRDLAVY